MTYANIFLIFFAFRSPSWPHFDPRVGCVLTPELAEDLFLVHLLLQPAVVNL